MKKQAILLGLLCIALCGCKVIRAAWESASGVIDKAVKAAESTTSNVVDVGTSPLK